MNWRYSKIPIYAGFFSLPFQKYDKPSFDGSVSADEYGKANPLNLSGIEGVKRMWSLNQYGAYSKEIETSIYSASYCGVIAGLWGGYKSGKESNKRFMEHNLGVKYVSELDAKKYLIDNITLGSLKGFISMALKMGLFSFAYMATASTVAVYRGKSGILDFSIGGAMAGGFYQFWNGPRAFLIGVVVGSAFGAVAGSFTYMTMLAAGKSYEDLQDWQMGLIESRNRAISEAKTPEWLTTGENAMLFQRKYDKEKDMFQDKPTV